MDIITHVQSYEFISITEHKKTEEKKREKQVKKDFNQFYFGYFFIYYNFESDKTEIMFAIRFRNNSSKANRENRNLRTHSKNDRKNERKKCI